MTSEALYERYKDALKRGHVASLRGRIDEALLAYADAAAIAPERSTPHASAGTALLRRKRPAEALRHYEVALSIAPRDETALLGRAQALAALDRRGEAADAFDALADVQAGSGRLADAVDAARHGLELAEGRERRRTLERLISRLRATEPDEPGRLALERALQVLDGPAVPHADSAHHAAGRGDKPADAPAGAAPEAVRDGEPADLDAVVDADVAQEAAAGAAGPDDDAADDAAARAQTADAVAEAEPSDAGALTAGGGAEPATVDAAEPEAAPAPPEQPGVAAVGADDAGDHGQPIAVPDSEDGAGSEWAPVLSPARRGIPADATAAVLAARAEMAADGASAGAAVDALLDLAAAEAADGRIDAALDACYAALSFDPDHVGLHLALVELYGVRGWDSLASEKLVLLDRLARLDADDEALAAIAGARSARR